MIDISSRTPVGCRAARLQTQTAGPGGAGDWYPVLCPPFATQCVAALLGAPESSNPYPFISFAAPAVFYVVYAAPAVFYAIFFLPPLRSFLFFL